MKPGEVTFGKTVLVTGATGFIGGALVERLARDRSVSVRALVSNIGNASRIARFPIELVQGDVTNGDAVLRAAEGCDLVFHCAYGNRGTARERRRVSVDGTRHVLEAAAKVGTARVVHLSTMLVYGMCVNGPLDESSPRCYSGDTYADDKVDAERLAFGYARKRGVPVVVLQPTLVYGPFAPIWTVNVIETLKRYRVILVNGGDGLSNPVYIDDLVTAMLGAARKREAVGEAFLVSGAERIDWRTFFGAFEAMLGEPCTVSMSLSEAKAFYRRSLKRPFFISECLRVLREQPELRKAVLDTAPLALLLRHGGPYLVPALKALLKMETGDSRKIILPGPAKNAEKPIQAARPSKLSFLAAKTEVRIDKAQRLLGYNPAVDFRTGMALTEKWARWANLIEPREAVGSITEVRERTDSLGSS